MEVRKEIPWYEWKYMASSSWSIRSIQKNKIMKPCITYKWYLYIRHKQKKLRVHRLVISAFKWCSDLHVNHKNCDKTDNNIENLEYCTIKENNEHYRNFINKL